jgi:hypothetical protein
VTEGKPADLRADIFAAGIVLWELLANRRLFYGKTDVETVDMVRKAEVPTLSKLNPEVSPELETIVAKALARDPKKRYTSAREMGEELADMLAKQGQKATSFDLAQMVDRLFGPAGLPGVSGAATEHAGQRQARIASLVDEEIANLSMLGFSPQVRGIQGSEPIDPAGLQISQINRPRFDLSSVWNKTGAPRAVVSDAKERAPTLRAMEDVGDLSGLVRMLEGSAIGALDWPEPGGTPKSGRHPTVAGLPAHTGQSGGMSKGLLWGLIALGAVSVGVVLAIVLQ